MDVTNRADGVARICLTCRTSMRPATAFERGERVGSVWLCVTCGGELTRDESVRSVDTGEPVSQVPSPGPAAANDDPEPV
jgi:hypothetical protein